MAEALTEAIKAKFDDFLDKYYKQWISDMILGLPGKRSLMVSVKDLEAYDPELASELIENPDPVIDAATESLKGKVEGLAHGDTELHVRFFDQSVNLPMVIDVGAQYISKLIMLDSLVVKRSEIIPKVNIGAYECTYCGASMRVRVGKEEIPELCPQCHRRSLKSSVEKSKYINLQKIAVQDPLERLRGNSPTQQFEVWLEDDLVNTVIPGDRVGLTGILRIRPRRNARGKLEQNENTMFLETVSIVPKQKEFAELYISDDDARLIKELAKDPKIFEKIANSIAPSIYGYDEIKQAVALQLFGGTPGKTLVDGGPIRSDMHILLIGDPGSAKTRILQAVARLVPKGIYVSGKSVTGGGMTAVAERDDFSEGGWTLKAGALVLGSGGIVCITENTEIYDGQRLIAAGSLWNELSGAVYQTKHGMEAKKAALPVTIYDRRAKTDMLHRQAFALLRRPYSGDIIKLTFASGLSLEVTPDHKLKRLANVKNLWVKASDVKAGDKLRAPVRVAGPVATLDVTEADAYVIGCVYGDGHIRNDSVVISQTRANTDIINNIMGKSAVFSLYDKKDRTREIEGHSGKSYVLVSRMYQMWTSNDTFVERVHFFLRHPSIDNILMLNDTALSAFIAGVFDTDGDFNRNGDKIIAMRMYPTKSLHELKVLLYALRRLGVRARIHDVHGRIPIIQVTGSDITLLTELIRPHSAKVNREKTLEIKQKRHMVARAEETVVSVERAPYNGYVYDLSVAKWHNYEASLVYIHNCIDEFDKIGDEDRAAMHEALESQTVSVAKAGIVATFNAKAAVLAAANPKYGRFDPNVYPAEQFDIPPTLLSRFDLIFPIKDTMDESMDKSIAKHILTQHAAAGAMIAELKSYNQVGLPPIDGELLRKYIALSKKTAMPRLSEEASNRIMDYYVELRRTGKKQGAVPITPRQIEGLIRMAEASAKTRLSDIVELHDAERAIALSEYMLKTLAVDRTGRYDADIFMTGMPKEKVDKINVILNIVKDLESKEPPAKMSRVKEEAERAGIDAATMEKLIGELEKAGDIFMPRPGIIATPRERE